MKMFRIDAEAMYKGLQVALLAECEVLTDWLWTQVQSKAPPEVNRDLIHKEVAMVAGQTIGAVSAAGMMALITEWGSGSLADSHPFVVFQALKRCRSFSTDQLVGFLEELLRLDVAFKSTAVDPQLSLERFLLGVCR